MNTNLKRNIAIGLVSAIATYFIVKKLDKHNLLPKSKPNETTN